MERARPPRTANRSSAWSRFSASAASCLSGMMGAGKTSIGRRLANLMHLPFLDADAEIEKAANLDHRGDFRRTTARRDFREGEQRVVARLLASGPAVLATGGGAFMNAETRERCRENGVTIWLKADVPVLLERVRKKGNRPLLEDRRSGCRDAPTLLHEREPIYSLADIVVASREGPHQAVIAEIVGALESHLTQRAAP